MHSLNLAHCAMSIATSYSIGIRCQFYIMRIFKMSFYSKFLASSPLMTVPITYLGSHIAIELMINPIKLIKLGQIIQLLFTPATRKSLVLAWHEGEMGARHSGEAGSVGQSGHSPH